MSPVTGGVGTGAAWGPTAGLSSQDLCDGMPDAIVVADEGGRILYANAQAEGLTGYAKAELVGLRVEDLIPERLREAHVGHRADFGAEPRWRGMGVGLDLICRRRDGSEVPIDVSLNPLETPEGPLVVAAIRDVTQRRDLERALVEADARFRGVFENVVEGIFVTTLDGRYVVANPALADMLGYASPEDLMASIVDVRLLYADPSEREDFIHRMEQDDQVMGYEYRVLRKDGSVIWVSENVRAIRGLDGSLVAYEGTSVDITERKRAQEGLRRRDATLQAVAFAAGKLLRAEHWEDVADEMLARLGEAAGVSRVAIFQNHEGAAGDLLVTERFEWNAPGIAGQLDNPANRDFPWVAGSFGRWAELLKRGEDVTGNVRDFPDSERPILEGAGTRSTVAMPVFSAGGWWGYLSFDECGGERDWSQAELDALRAAADALGSAIGRERSEAALQQSIDLLRHTDEQRRRLLSRLVVAQEEERRRIASDIHDDSVQQMTAVDLRLEVLRRRVEGNRELEDLVGKIRHVVEGSIARLRHLMFELHPSELDREGLATALRQRLEIAFGGGEPAYRMEDRLTAEPDPEVRVVAYRIIQEALVNVRKHASASNVSVLLENRDGGVLVRVADDGVGFTPLGEGTSVPGHFGLVDMRERAEMAGGWARVESAPGTGTTVVVWLPAHEPPPLG